VLAIIGTSARAREMRRDQRCRGRSEASRVDCHMGNTSRANASCPPPRTRRRQTAGLLVSSCQPDTWTGRTAAVRQWTAAWQHSIQRALQRPAPRRGPQHGRWPVRLWQAVRATSVWNSSGTVLHIERHGSDGGDGHAHHRQPTRPPLICIRWFVPHPGQGQYRSPGRHEGPSHLDRHRPSRPAASRPIPATQPTF
jgi:hypothetical protein